MECALIAEAQLEILGVCGIQQPQSHQARRNFGYRGDRPVHDDSVASRSIYDGEPASTIFNRSIRTECATLEAKRTAMLRRGNAGF